MLLAASGAGLAQAGGKSRPRAGSKSATQASENRAPTQPSSPFPRIAYDERAWKPFESSDGGFTISFPGKPGFQTQPVQTALAPLVNHIHGLDIGVAFFAVAYADVPVSVSLTDRELINRALDAGRDRALAGTGDKLISEAPLTLDGYTGRYVLSSHEGGLTHSQSYVVGNRLYQLDVVSDDYRNSPAEDQKFFADLVKRFFNSFKLTRKAY